MRTWAYPRSRGGTWRYSAKLGPLKGLSPLTRGNQPTVRVPAAYGPIPAHAGEPVMVPILPSHFWAYPRSRVAAGAIMQRFGRSGNADGFWASNTVFAANPGMNSRLLQTSTLTRGNHIK